MMTQSDEEISKWLLAVFVFDLDERIFKIDRARGRSWAGLGCRGLGCTRTGQPWWLLCIKVHAELLALRGPIVEILQDRQVPACILDDWRGGWNLGLNCRWSWLL